MSSICETEARRVLNKSKKLSVGIYRHRKIWSIEIPSDYGYGYMVAELLSAILESRRFERYEWKPRRVCSWEPEPEPRARWIRTVRSADEALDVLAEILKLITVDVVTIADAEVYHEGEKVWKIIFTSSGAIFVSTHGRYYCFGG